MYRMCRFGNMHHKRYNLSKRSDGDITYKTLIKKVKKLQCACTLVVCSYYRIVFTEGGSILYVQKSVVKYVHIHINMWKYKWVRNGASKFFP